MTNTNTITFEKLTDLMTSGTWEFSQGDFVETSREEMFDSWDESTGTHVAGYVEMTATCGDIELTYTERYGYTDGDGDTLEHDADWLSWAFESDIDVTDDGDCLGKSIVNDIIRQNHTELCFFPDFDWSDLNI